MRLGSDESNTEGTTMYTSPFYPSITDIVHPAGLFNTFGGHDLIDAAPATAGDQPLIA